MPSPTQVAFEVFEQATHPNSLACPEMARIQSVLKSWEKSQFGEVPITNTCLGVSEEVGELHHAVLKRSQGIRGMDNQEAFLEAAGDAIADVTIYLMQIASSLHLDFFTLVVNTAADVVRRDWRTNKETGK